jgi:hypothetical protein
LGFFQGFGIFLPGILVLGIFFGDFFRVRGFFIPGSDFLGFLLEFLGDLEFFEAHLWSASASAVCVTSDVTPWYDISTVFLLSSRRFQKRNRNSTSPLLFSRGRVPYPRLKDHVRGPWSPRGPPAV